VKILVISSILPIPGALADNDFIYRLYGHYRKLYPDDRVEIIMPVKYDLNIRTILRKQTRIRKLGGKLEWEIQGFQVHIFPFFAAWSFRNLHALVSHTAFWVNRKRISLLMRNQSFDLIHARFIFADGLLAAQISRRYGMPYVVATHKEMFYFDHFYSRKKALELLRGGRLILPVSHMNLEYFRSLGMPHVHQLSHGFSASFIRTQRQQEEGQVRVLSVCRLLDWKNIHLVIRALGTLRGSLDFHYTIIGDGPEKERLIQEVEEQELRDHVTFIPHVKHELMADEMQRHDLFVLPSYFETFGRVYFECMAMGIPVICAKNSGIYGLFRDGEEALSVDHRRQDELVRVLEQMLRSREERMRIGKNGQELVKRFTWDNIARQLKGYYRECLQPEHTPLLTDTE
jgi:glycosyltransferase involved in cell wall biosynthesis